MRRVLRGAGVRGWLTGVAKDCAVKAQRVSIWPINLSVCVRKPPQAHCATSLSTPVSNKPSLSVGFYG